MDVSADHARHPALAAELEHRVFVVGHVLHRALRPQLDVRRERPVAEAEAAADPVDHDVHVEDLVVEHRADALQQAVEVHESVELVAVDDEVLFPVGARVYRALGQLYRPERDPEELLQELVVVAGDERHPGVLSVFPQELLDQRVVIVVPEPLAAQLPPINEIAHDVEVGGFGVAEEFEEFADLGVFGTQVHVGDPDSAIVHRRLSQVAG
jgi:hypothetical protein